MEYIHKVDAFINKIKLVKFIQIICPWEIAGIHSSHIFINMNVIARSFGAIRI